jgi:hypothetical protein
MPNLRCCFRPAHNHVEAIFTEEGFLAGATERSDPGFRFPSGALG